MDLQIRQLQQDEWDVYAHTVQIGLSFQATEEELAEWKRMFEFDRSIAALDGSAIVGTGGAFSLDMTLPGGRTIPTGALTAISVLPTHRRRGVLRSMIRRHFDDVLERGGIQHLRPLRLRSRRLPRGAPDRPPAHRVRAPRRRHRPGAPAGQERGPEGDPRCVRAPPPRAAR